ncbi:hypothetical protein GYN16_10500 [Lactococcus piscium]|uniref:DUF6980 domain-containing protein n=3 Tax=Streptococcaceae TaxID=1300 RepID=A0A0D6DX74_9LACT|nr:MULTISPECIES: hypothetical protein [Lactococcus]MCJ1972237.1 hypothetical protein [Lactococcus carnosus]MCJ2001090.1 hypothetical protein [Lactococcus carnosus]CEN28337.1 Uncharacterized protein LACPI_1137 [Lactococcus piscium MKFS47]
MKLRWLDTIKSLMNTAFLLGMVVGQKSQLTIPWCGKKLPESKLDDYMAILETLDIYGIGDEKIPDELKRDDWWEKRLCNKEGK